MPLGEALLTVLPVSRVGENADLSLLEILSSRGENHTKQSLHILKKIICSKLWTRYILQTKINKNYFQTMCKNQLAITLSDLHKHTHSSYTERIWCISTGTSTPVTFADVCYCFKVSLAQLPKWKFQFNGKLETDALNLTLVKKKSETCCPTASIWLWQKVLCCMGRDSV